MFFGYDGEKNEMKIALENSGPYIGATYPNDFGVYGNGIKIAIIDTGVNYNHPDLYGFGKDGNCLLYTSPSPRDRSVSRMPSSA